MWGLVIHRSSYPSVQRLFYGALPYWIRLCTAEQQAADAEDERPREQHGVVTPQVFFFFFEKKKKKTFFFFFLF